MDMPPKRDLVIARSRLDKGKMSEFTRKWMIVWLVLLTGPFFTVPAGAQIINTLRGFDEEKQGWSGGFEGTIAISEGNSEYHEIQLAASIQHQSLRNRWRLLGRSMWLKASGRKAAENQLAHLRHNYIVLPWLASVVFIQGQHDPFRRVETRILFGAGARIDVLKKDRWNVALGLTAMREDEKLTEKDDRFVTNYRLSGFLTVFRDAKKGIDMDVTAFYQPMVDDLTDARALAAASFRTDIVGNLYFLLSYSFEYDARPPLGVERYDQMMRSGLGYNF